MASNSQPKPVLLTSGKGKTSRRIAAKLASLDIPFRAASRSTDIPFDWNNPKTWRPALAGVSAAYIAYQPDLAVPGAVRTVTEFVAEALAAGVERLVLLSGRGEEEAQLAEDIVKASGADWTIVRASWFAQNFSESFFRDGLMSGILEIPAGDVQEPFIDVDDIADVVVAALTDPRHIGETYEVTGPRLLSFRDAVQAIAEATGQPIAYKSISATDYAIAMEAQGVPTEMVSLVFYLFTTLFDGRNAYVADGVWRALGRPPRDFLEYVQKTADAGAWKAAA